MKSMATTQWTRGDKLLVEDREYVLAVFAMFARRMATDSKWLSSRWFRTRADSSLERCLRFCRTYGPEKRTQITR